MPIRILRAIAWIIMTLNATSAVADVVVPPQYFGTYTGLDLYSVVSGVSWEESLTRLDIDRSGITLYANRDQRERQWKIHYPAEWLFAPHERCLGIKRHLGVERPELIRLAFALCFEEVDPAGVRRMRMTDADAMPLGEYAIQISGEPKNVLWWLRDRFDEVAANARQSMVRQPSARDVLVAVTGQDHNRKIQALRELRRYVNDLAEPDVPHYFDAVIYGLNDEARRVQLASIEVIERAARFTYAVEPLRALITRPDTHAEVLSHAVHAMGALLYESNQLLERREAFRKSYGAIDMDEIFERTGGVIEANDAPSSLLDIFKLHPPPSRAWTLDLRQDMLRTLDLVARTGPSPDVQEEAHRITKYLGKTLKSANGGCRPELVASEPEI